MKQTTPLTAEQEAYIVAHLNDRPRTEVARAAGCSLSAVYRIVRRHGGRMLTERTRRNPEWVRIVREHYATMSGHEIERKFGITFNRANSIAHDLGLKHNAETMARLKRKERETLSLNRSKCDWQKKAATWKRRRRLDEWRVWEGKPQKTRFLFAKMTKRAYKAKHNLMRCYGYKPCPDDAYTLLYDAGTRRRPLSGYKWGTEGYYSKKYNLKFKEDKMK